MVRNMSSIPTTFELDGLFTDIDISNRFLIMKPCVSCLKYSKYDVREKTIDCQFCHSKISINGRYWYSIRTWNPSKKITPSEKKKL